MLVSIVVAVYKPNMKYLMEQLRSINNQTYSEIEVLIRDDSDDNKVFEEVKVLVNDILKNVPFKISQNKENLGSNKTFEILTVESKGEFIAYCDQDDIWELHKIETLVKEMDDKTSLVYSNLSVIDKDNNQILAEFKEMRKRINYVSGENLFGYFIRRNCITGCTMLVRSKVAKGSVAFNDLFVHDHWIGLNASRDGNIKFLNENLVRYRIHGKNQIGASKMPNIVSRKDYIEKKLYIEKRKLAIILENIEINEVERKEFDYHLKVLQSRISMFDKDRLKFKERFSCIKNLRYDYMLIGFEIILSCVSERIARKMILKVKKSDF